MMYVCMMYEALSKRRIIMVSGGMFLTDTGRVYWCDLGNLGALKPITTGDLKV